MTGGLSAFDTLKVMATKAQAERAMRAIGLDPAKHLDLDPSEPTYAMLDAPKGRNFTSESAHSVSVGEDRKADMYDNIIRHCKQGMRFCGQGGCEACEQDAVIAAHRAKLGFQFQQQ